MTEQPPADDDEQRPGTQLTDGLHRYELTEERPLGRQLLETVEATTQSAQTGSPPLYETLDVEYLEGLLETDGHERVDVTFRFDGWQFEVHGRDSVLAIRRPTSAREQSASG
jgi:hypothetical protein